MSVTLYSTAWVSGRARGDPPGQVTPGLRGLYATLLNKHPSLAWCDWDQDAISVWCSGTLPSVLTCQVHELDWGNIRPSSGEKGIGVQTLQLGLYEGTR